ncbi:hypothetical protein K439DRAFT_151333 [Ramaria rubella]|nr:hypothetical protein K439DRAFT_151333 [Ramaria rubella]
MPVLLPLFFLLLSAVSASPPILSQPLTAQLTPDNPAVSSAFLIPPTSALLVNTSSPYPALRVPPSWSFSVGFSGTTFQPPPHGSQELVYTAQLDSGDPLPDWLVFADDTITFGGVTPKESVGIQVLRIVVTAATDANMTTSDTFTLIVCSHDLSLSGGPLLTRNITATSPFTLPLTDFTGVLLDGAPPTSQTLSDSSNLTLALDLTAFPWLSYDPSSCTVSGTPPADAHPHAPLPPIPARVTLELPGTTQTLSVATNVTLMVMPSVFTAGTLPALQAPPETQIAFALAPFLTGTVNPRRRRADTDAYTNLNANPPPNTHITAAWTPSNASFLSFDPTRLLLTGTVPASSSAPSKIQEMRQ